MSEALSHTLRSHQTYGYTSFETPLRPNFTLKQGWEYILTKIGYAYHNTSPTSELIQAVKDTLQTAAHPNPLLTTSGGGRDVYILPETAHTSSHDHVVKFPKSCEDGDLDGQTQNWQEAHIWDAVDNPQSQDKLVPTSATHDSHVWNIMPRGCVHTDIPASEEEIDEFLDDVYADIGHIGDVGEKIGPSEYKPHNVVSIDRSLYMCDYGYQLRV